MEVLAHGGRITGDEILLIASAAAGLLWMIRSAVTRSSSAGDRTGGHTEDAVDSAAPTARR